MLRAALLAPICFVVTPSRTDARAPARTEHTDEQALRAFAALAPSDRREVVEYFAMEASALGTFQSNVVRAVLSAQDRDSGLWPAAQEAPFFDPKEHAKGQPIARRVLDAKSSRAREFRRRVFDAVQEPRLDCGWAYDYGTRGLVKLASHDDPVRVFRNALAGFPPDADLAVALVVRALDDGSQQKALAAYAHAYTDRAGNVYPGVTLYDAWGSGVEIEMPDVDTLGIVHTVLGDWDRWTAPVADQDSLYDALGEIFQDARRHRGLRNALASTFVCGSAILRDGYGSSLDNLHALWQQHANDPTSLAKKLPAAKDWKKFLDDWAKKCRADKKLYGGALSRHATLDNDGRAVRAVLMNALEEFGAFAKITSEPARTNSSADPKDPSEDH